MPLSFGDNINYQGKLPNFRRDSFDTLEEMKNFPPTSLDEGHISRCNEDGKRYKFLSNNPFDEITGYWREIIGNEVSNTEPIDKSNLWFDKSSNDLSYSKVNTDVGYILDAIAKLQEIVARHEYAFTHEMNPGGFTNSARMDMINAAEPENPLTGESEETPPETDTEEEPTQYTEPNVKHICIKAGKYLDMLANKENFVDNELLWCTDKRELYIMSNGKLINIAATSGGGGEPSGDYITPDDLKNLESIGFVSPNGQKYIVKINNDGSLNIYNDKLDIPQEKPNGGQDDGSGWIYTTELFLQKLYINSIYCGGLTSDEHSYNGCSHNFVELSNLTNQDINLNGLSLQYGTEGGEWKVLPLWGIIKAQSTFLIRGAQCSVMDANTTKIKVKSYDIEWYDGGSLIKFDSNKSKFFLTWGTDKAISNPYSNKSGNIKISLGYVDLVGLNKSGAQSVDVVDASEKSPYAFLETGKLFCKYYTMDPVKQATKDLSARDNSKDWYYVDLTKDNIIPSVEAFTPKASFENKNIFFNKSRLNKEKPNCINITLGKKATSPSASRCFNWISVDYYDEFIWYKKKEEGEWKKVESFKSESGVRKYYNRIRSEATDGTPFTVHKVIIKDLDEGTYEYKIGRLGTDGKNPGEYVSDTREFKVISDTTAASFKFVQTSDQQGFNWDEYQVWKKSADYIGTNVSDINFLINTGDLTQNGNRFNEWLDYFEGRESLKNYEEMTTIGNNDLCPSNLYKLGDGGDSSKINSMNMTFFYTYEMDEENPPIFNIESKECYIPSIYSFDYGNTHFICVNSEIPDTTETAVYGLSSGGKIYPEIKKWCETDISKASDKKWKIAYCHEMPFTIITQNVINNFFWEDVENSGIERSGSRINTNVPVDMKYWFSQFCQNNGIRLVLGGHKHTYSCSWPIKENGTGSSVKSMRPIIQVTETDLTTTFESEAELYTESGGDLDGCKYPSKWRDDENYKTMKHLCTFEKVESITAPIYAMCQATGYKHTSNKELPAPKIPWLRYYFPATVKSTSQTNVTATVNAGQKYPFYIIWEVSEGQITGTAKKLNNIFNSSGKFNINTPQSGSPEELGGNGETNGGNDQIIIK